jgi:hypothetical protein
LKRHPFIVTRYVLRWRTQFTTTESLLVRKSVSLTRLISLIASYTTENTTNCDLLRLVLHTYALLPKSPIIRFSKCGQGSYRWQNVTMTRVPDLTLCHRSYSTNGNWETRFELQVPDERTGELLTEWAYAPYIGHSASSAGPKVSGFLPLLARD